MAPFDPRVELLVGSTWTDISTRVRVATGGCRITRGRGSEGATTDAQTCVATLDNRDGMLSSRRPTGAWFGLIGRHTRLRVSLPAASSYLEVDPAGEYASCPDAAGISITGDIDIRWDGWLPSFRTPTSLAWKYNLGQRSYYLGLDAAGTLSLHWSTDGTAELLATSTAAVPSPIWGRRALRATLDVDSGASRTITFYTAATLSGTWVQLGDPVVQSGTTSIYDSTSPLYAYLSVSTGRVYGLKVLQGIPAGTERANPDFTTQSDGTASFADAAGNTWSVSTGCRINGRDWRVWGEVSEWPARSDVSGSDITVPITASGIMRRLGSGSKPLKSAYLRGCTSPVAPVQDLVAYWPLEDAAGSASLASGIPGGRPARIVGSPTLASDAASFPCSAPLPVMTTGAMIVTPAPQYAATGEAQVWILVHVPETGVTSDSRIMLITCTGTAARWAIVVTPGGNLRVLVEDVDLGVLDDHTWAFAANGRSLRVMLQMEQSGGNVLWALSTLEVGHSTGSTSGTQTITGVTCGQVGPMYIGPDKNLTLTVGHLTVQSQVTSIFILDDLLNAYQGETACDRIERLCGEEGVAVRVIGATPGTSLMGAQGQRTLLELLRECESVDGGILYEPTDFFGLAYRSGRSLCNQAAQATLDYGARQVAPPFDPTDDDQRVLNDVTASRASGSSYRYVKSSGTLSTADPPAGVGVCDGQAQLNILGDDLLPGAASWLVHLGTVDEPRIPGIGVNLAHPTYTGSATLTAAVAGLDVGDRLDISHPPAWLPPDTIRQLAIGYTELLTEHTRSLTFVGHSESPYRVLEWETSAARWCSGVTTLAEDLTTTETGVDIAISGGRVWGHGDGNFDVMIGGERMTVTAVTGATSPQTLTVTRSVNLVVKTHATGAQVLLFDPRYWTPR